MRKKNQQNHETNTHIYYSFVNMARKLYMKKKLKKQNRNYIIYCVLIHKKKQYMRIFHKPNSFLSCAYNQQRRNKFFFFYFFWLKCFNLHHQQQQQQQKLYNWLVYSFVDFVCYDKSNQYVQYGYPICLRER